MLTWFSSIFILTVCFSVFCQKTAATYISILDSAAASKANDTSSEFDFTYGLMIGGVCLAVIGVTMLVFFIKRKDIRDFCHDKLNSRTRTRMFTEHAVTRRTFNDDMDSTFDFNSMSQSSTA